jgi:hypothetical protein
VRAVAAITLAGCLVLGACGGESGDLMAIEVAGGFAKGRGPLDIVVANDGRGTCNDRPEESLPSDLVIDAREIERELSDLAEEGATFDEGRAGGGRYVVRIKAGTVRWAEGDPGLPPELPRAQLLALRLDRLLCRP